MEKKRIFKDGSSVVIGHVLTSIIGLVNLALLSRVLTTEEMGKYSLFLMVVNLALVLGLNWSDSSIVRHGREEYVLDKKINKSFWARTYLFVPVLIIFTLIFITYRTSISNYVGIEEKYISLVISLFLLNGLVNWLIFTYQSIDQMRKSAYLYFLQKLFFLICLGIIFLKKVSPKISLILIMINLSFLFSFLFNLTRFDFKLIRPYNFSKEYFKKIWSFSWPQLIGFSGIYTIKYIDLYVIKKYLSLSDVGIYNISYNGFTMIIGTLMIIYVIFMPLIVEYKSKKRYDRIKKYVAQIPILTLAWGLIALLIMFTSSLFIPLIFSDKYIMSIPSFNILMIASIFSFISICFLPLLNAFDYVKIQQTSNIISAGANIFLDFKLVPKMGIVGAAYATLITYALGLLIKIVWFIIVKKKILGEETNE